MNRDCMNSFSGSYPVYPMPYMPMNQAPIIPMNQNMNQMPINNQNSDLASIKNELSKLDRRITNIENMLSNNYNSSNFQVI